MDTRKLCQKGCKTRKTSTCAFCARPAACGQLSVPTRRHPTSWSRQPPAKILFSEAKVPAKTDQGNEDVQLYAQANNQAKASSRGFPAAAPGTPREPRPHCAATAPGMLMQSRVWPPGRTSEIVHGKQRNPTQKKAFSVFLFLFFFFFSAMRLARRHLNHANTQKHTVGKWR